jgi:hypothetical protein
LPMSRDWRSNMMRAKRVAACRQPRAASAPDH